MAREWMLEPGANISNKTLEGMLIEAYGCVSLDNRVINLDSSRSGTKIESAFYMDGNTLEGSLIEIFGCTSLNDRVINLDASRDRKRIRTEAIRQSVKFVDSATLQKRLA